jgi:type IV pilus assembly protein PilM
MEILPKTLGTRPRLAVEVRAEGVVAARAEDAAALLTSVARVDLASGVVAPGLKPGNLIDKSLVTAAVKKALDTVSGRGSSDRAERGAGRLRDVTLVVPDSAVRVLFLDFDQLPTKTAEALPLVRFRLKKLLPFDADDAMVSYQVMASEKGSVRLLAVAIPKAVLEEYEAMVLAAGYLPGAVLPSTLAALAGLDETPSPLLVVNASLGAVTTAIVQAGVLLLHRSVDMGAGANAGAPIEMLDTALPLVDRESSVQEWAQQEPLGAGGWDEYDAPSAIQPSMLGTALVRHIEVQAAAREVAQAVSVAAAYFEDSLQTTPEQLLMAGTLGADALTGEYGLEGLRVREIVDSGMMEAGAVTSTVPRGWLAGVRGALRN